MTSQEHQAAQTVTGPSMAMVGEVQGRFLERGEGQEGVWIQTPPIGCRLPDFFIVGAAKSGTTTLYHYLERHPQIFLSTPKEMSFFSKDHVYHRGFSYYSALFASAGNDQKCGEASTTYTRHPTYPDAALRMFAAAPQARLIYLLRNPVDRLYSFYSHRMRERVTSDLDSFLEATPEAIDSGRYMTQIRELTKHYDAAQLKVLFLEDLAKQPAVVLTQVCRHLQVEDRDLLSAGTIRSNPGQGMMHANAVFDGISAAMKALPPIRWVTQLVPGAVRHRCYQRLIQGSVGQKLRKRHMARLTPLTSARRQFIWELYADEIDELQDFLQRDLQHWRPR